MNSKILENFFNIIQNIISYNKSDNFYNYKEKLRFKGGSVFDYSFLMALDEKDYPKYLSQAYYIKFAKKLNLRSPKTLNEKIQWLKLYDNLPIKTQLTDKILVRDWIENRIGSEYLKPILQIASYYEEIDFSKLPENIIIKCNHGCKWHFIIKSKNKFLADERLYNFAKQQIDGWLSQTFFGWSDFETQYKNIKPQLFVEQYFADNIIQIQIWCFNGVARIIQKIWNKYSNGNIFAEVSTFDENYNFIDLNFTQANLVKTEIDEIVKKAVELSMTLSSEFKFVRVDWMVAADKLYFEEMTFTPFSGFIQISKEHQYWQKKLGKMLKLKEK